MKGAIAVVAILAASALAGPVEPTALPQLSPKPTGGGPLVEVYATKIHTDHLLRALYDDSSFVMIAKTRTFEGRIDKPVPRDAAIGAIVGGDTPVKLSPGGSTLTIDLDFFDAPVADLIRICADTVRVDLVYAVSKEPPTVTVRAKRIDAKRFAREVIKLVGLEMIERDNAWVIVDKGTKLDPKLAATTLPGANLRLKDATPGEFELLLDPKATPGACPTDRTINASIRRGQTGLVRAVAATIQGAPCKVASAPDFKTGSLVGTLRVGDKLRRGAFRLASGIAVFEPDPAKGQEIGEGFAMIGKDVAIELYPRRLQPSTSPTDDWRTTTPCGSKAASRGYTLRATVKIGNRWRAVLVDSSGLGHLVSETSPIGGTTIAAGRVQCDGGPRYRLTAP